MPEPLTTRDLEAIARALDFMACESSLPDRMPLPFADKSSAPLRRLAERVRELHDAEILADHRARNLAGSFNADHVLEHVAGDDFYGLT